MNKNKAQPRWLIAYMITATTFSSASLLAQSIPAEAADALTRAGECSVNGRSMTLKNDGGWCWNVVAISAPRMGKKAGITLSSNALTVASQPQHGQVAIADVEDGKVRIAYRPAAGFAGDDKFTLHNQVRAQDVTYLVSVQR
jgi:hypothetical protein